MTKIDIFSGFLGAGKTTLIKKLIKEAYAGEKLVLIENEFGEIGIDGGFLKDAGIEITEMNSGCICCSLVGDFTKALGQVLTEFAPDRILIEPSGVGKLSDVIRAVEGVATENVQLGNYTTVVDANKCKMYLKNFGEFFGDQIENAHTVILSHTDRISEEKLAKCVELIRSKNDHATLVTTPWDALTGEQILAAMEHSHTTENVLEELAQEAEHHHHPHHDCDCHDHDHDHEHEHHHDHDCDCHDHDHEHHHHDHDHEHEHHHHDHDHEHHHDHEEGCTCSCCCGHDHDHDHHHHHADDVFTSWGVETTKTFTAEELNGILEELINEGEYGMVLRAKGIVPAKDGTWLHFDYVPGEGDVRTGSADVIGRLCVIGAGINQEKLAALFGI
ncbi:MAG: GTP-binding protein [Clostridia bacterium]|nr:GTP-binding protein [Clostridia bacterium]